MTAEGHRKNGPQETEVEARTNAIKFQSRSTPLVANDLVLLPDNGIMV